MRRWAAALGGLLVGLAGCRAAQAQGIAPHSRVFTFAAPPVGFDPSTASDSELARYGLPPMPDPFAGNRLAYTTWVHAMRKARHYLAPQLRLDPRQRRPAFAQAGGKAGTLTSNNWVGRAITGPATSYGPTSLTEAEGQWVVSAVIQGAGICAPTSYVSATWVGMDGLTGSDVSQAGTESDSSCDQGLNVQDDYAWFEWYPADGYEITNFPIMRGGSIFVVVQDTSATAASATFVNLQNGNYTVAGFNAPAGTKLIGNSVEWIVERPTGDNNQTGTLANFGEIPMESEIAYTVSQLGTSTFSVPGAPTPGEASDTVTMQLISGTVIATVVTEGVSAQLAQVAGPTQ